MMDHAPGIDLLDVDSRTLGDTGSNLAAALSAIAAAVGAAPPGLLHAARALSTAAIPDEGRSATLLRRQLRGWSEVLAARDSIGPADLALAFEAGADALDDSSPLAGSMSSVARAAADAALLVLDRSGSLADVAIAANEAALDALDDSATTRPALVDHGVVDAGGAGWTIVLDAILDRVLGDEFLDVETADDGPDPGRYAVSLRLSASDPVSGSPLVRSVEDGLAGVWSSLGTDVDVAAIDPPPETDGTPRWLCSVRCDDIGPVIEAALQWGRPSRITVEDTWSARRP